MGTPVSDTQSKHDSKKRTKEAKAKHRSERKSARKSSRTKPEVNYRETRKYEKTQRALTYEDRQESPEAVI